MDKKEKYQASNKSVHEYLSDVRHDLRGELIVIREGISQVLDGFGKNNCSKCFEILREGLSGVDGLNKLIDKLLSDVSFKSALKDRSLLEDLKNEIIRMIAHIVRTQLTIIKEGLSLVLDEIPGKLNSEQKKYLNDVKESVDKLVKSIEDILKKPWEEIING